MEAQTPAPGVLGTKIPSTVLFTIGVLLFFMPFAEIKCKQSSNSDFGGLNMDFGGQMNISNTGFGLAIGKQWDVKMGGLGDMFGGNQNVKKDQPKQDPNYYAIAAMALGIIGLLLCLAKSKALNWAAMLTGILSAAALIGLKFDLDGKAKDPSKEITSDTSQWGMDSLANIHITYTPWFYIAVLAMIMAAVLCYLRMKNSRAS